jgi:hypothetical protein
MLQLPAIKCTQSVHANAYQTAMRVHELVPYLLNGHDPRSQNWKNLPSDVREMYEKLQRKTSKSRRTEMRNYILRRMAPGSYWIGAVPPIVVGMQLGQPFEALPSSDGRLGYVKVRTRLDRPNILLDGLGRITGFLDVMYDDDLSDDVQKWAGDAEIPVMLVTPPSDDAVLSLEELGQIFHDMNVLATPVGKGQAVDLDRSDLYIQTVNRVAALPIIKTNGGCEDRAISISRKSGAWTTKTVLLKTVRAAAEGPGSHVDHIRDQLDNPFLVDEKTMGIVAARIDDALSAFVEALSGGEVPPKETLLRTPSWWVAFGLFIHDLNATYEGASLSDERKEALLRRAANIDWGLGNPEFAFLGSSVEEKATGMLPKDALGRPMLNRFFGGSKAYYNLAAFIREKSGLKELVDYGPDYGATLKHSEAELPQLETV